MFLPLFIYSCSVERDMEQAMFQARSRRSFLQERYYRGILKKNPQYIPALEGLGWLYHLWKNRTCKSYLR